MEVGCWHFAGPVGHEESRPFPS